jgi:alkylation response protein AidB-like acyl-CoA dehydrogenase
MTQIAQAWGAGPTPRYEALAEPFRPLFARIAAEAVEREQKRVLPFDQIEALKQAGFTAVRTPRAYGGQEATLPELANLLIELSEADSNVAQSLRLHFGFTEDALNALDAKRRDSWLKRIASGETVGSAWSEIGETKVGELRTKIVRDGDGWRLTGRKYYTTGSLYADWIHVGAQREDGEFVGALVRRRAPGVEVIDDWDGFGQTLTASGTTVFEHVAVDDAEVVPDVDQLKYGSGFYQLYHLATLAGIGRGAVGQVARLVAERRRVYSNSAGPRPSQDPQVLQVVGRARGQVYAAGAIVLKAAEALQRAYETRFSGDETADAAANAIAELETAEAQTVVIQLVLDAVTALFDALGASAAQRSLGLDRYWRNARTLANHNPRIYKDRIVGDFAVNGTEPPYQWRIGVG